MEQIENLTIRYLPGADQFVVRFSVPRIEQIIDVGIAFRVEAYVNPFNNYIAIYEETSCIRPWGMLNDLTKIAVDRQRVEDVLTEFVKSIPLETYMKTLADWFMDIMDKTSVKIEELQHQQVSAYSVYKEYAGEYTEKRERKFLNADGSVLTHQPTIDYILTGES